MAMYHSEPNRSEPASHLWFSVSTPGVFREYRLPACNTAWSKADWSRFRELELLAESHRTVIHRCGYRRG